MSPVSDLKVLAYKGSVMSGSCTLTDSLGKAHDFRFRADVHLRSSDDVGVDADLLAPGGEWLTYNDLILPEGASDDELGYVLTGDNTAGLFLTDADYHAAHEAVEHYLMMRVFDAQSAAERAFDAVIGVVRTR